MRIVIHDGERRISTREFAKQWPMEHKQATRKVRDLLRLYPQFEGCYFAPNQYHSRNGAGVEIEATEFLMNWEGFWMLATSFQGDKAMHARVELVEAVKRALSEQKDLATLLAETQARLEEAERRSRLYAERAKDAASEAGRALNAWKQTNLRMQLEAGGQDCLPLEIEFPDPMPSRSLGWSDDYEGEA